MEERRLQGRGECQSWQAKSSEKKRKTRTLEGEVVQDLNGDVHMKLSVPLVSRENRGPARVCNCTVFQQRESAIIQKMQVAGWLYSDKVAEQVNGARIMGSPLAPGPSCSVS